MVKSKLPNAVLGKIWKLADVDQDGQLDGDEFALANYLINLKLEGRLLDTKETSLLTFRSRDSLGTSYSFDSSFQARKGNRLPPS